MAAPKLTLKQRKSLRLEISRRLKKKEVVADIVNTLSTKYQVATMTIRRYVSQSDERPAPRPKKPKRKSGRKRHANGQHNGTIFMDVELGKVVLEVAGRKLHITNVICADPDAMAERLRKAVCAEA